MVKKKSPLVALVLFVIGLISVVFLSSWVTSLAADRLQQSANDEALEKLLLAKSTLEASLFRDVFLSDSLATVFSIDPEIAYKNFHAIARRMLEKSENVRNIGVAPDDIIAKNFPAEGNEKAIGLDFRTVPSQYETVLAARLSKDVYLAGPLELVQGGTAIIARLPIFDDYPRSENYWGSISVVIDYEKLMKASGLSNMSNAKIALRGVNGLGQQGEVFEGDVSSFNNADYQGKIVVPNGEWWIAANFDTTLTDRQKLALTASYWGIIALYAILYGGVYLLWRYYRAERKLANQDPLTGLFNRRFVFSYLEKLLSKQRDSAQFCILAIDLNRFKEINDLLGHEVGDDMLRLVAESLEESTRASDIVARLGGDEFLVILNRVDNNNVAEQKLNQIKQYVESKALQTETGSIAPSLSIGFSLSSETNNGIPSLLKIADERMYKNKQDKTS